MQHKQRRSPTDRRPLNTGVLNLRMTEAQRLEILREAAAKGVSMAAVARDRIFGTAETPAANDAA